MDKKKFVEIFSLSSSVLGAKSEFLARRMQILLSDIMYVSFQSLLFTCCYFLLLHDFHFDPSWYPKWCLRGHAVVSFPNLFLSYCEFLLKVIIPNLFPSYRELLGSYNDMIFSFFFFVRKESKFLSPWHWKIEEFQKIWKKVEEYLRLLETYGGIWFSFFLMGSLQKLIFFFLAEWDYTWN